MASRNGKAGKQAVADDEVKQKPERALKAKEVDKFRRILEIRLNQAQVVLAKSLPGTIASDPGDMASQETDLTQLVHDQQCARQEVRRISAALQNMKTGEYGECKACGEQIPRSRLSAEPTTLLCLECKKAQEAEQQKRGVSIGYLRHVVEI
ncbi:MAG: TraR/DksA C4-type zinc finger protein [Candidatus Parcubacteria bacterium]|nr:TraR/DksA C4-type zinc finger protein [Candidatus Parcubacteria bacterium]